MPNGIAGVLGPFLTRDFDQFAAALYHSKSDAIHIQFIVGCRSSSARRRTFVISSLKVLDDSRLLALISLLQFLLPSLLYSFCSLLAIFLEDGRIDELKVAVLLRDPSSSCITVTSGRSFSLIGCGCISSCRCRVTIQYKCSISVNLRGLPSSMVSARGIATAARSP
jgi:hypothetical protein